MAVGMVAGGRFGYRVATGRRRSPSSIGALRALCGLLVLCAGCTSSPGEATSASRAGSLRAVALRTDTLLLKPVERGRLSSAYGVRYHPILKRRQMHRGIDWAAPRGTPVRAAGDGVVVAAARFAAYGHYVRIEHGRTVATTYAHLERYAPGLRPGRRVRQGDLIGRVGSTGGATGAHLHYEVLVAGHQVDPLAVAPIVRAPAAEPPAPVPETGPEGELGIGGPNTIAADGETGDAPSAAGLDLRSLPPDADGGMIRIEDLLSLRP
jgi:murein DD-endopeptidase MepM/ murein hydrolase activator NlpD